MPIVSPYGYNITDATNAWVGAGAALETAVDAVARTEAEQKTYPAQGKINTMAYALEQIRQILNGALDIPGPIIVNGNFTQDAASATHTIGSGAGSPTTTAKVSATGVYGVQVDDGTNANDGGWSYDAQFNTFIMRAANASQIYVQDGSIYPVLNNDVNSGLTANRWLAGFYNSLTVGANFTMDSASPSATIGAGTGSPTLGVLKSDAGFGSLRFQADSTTESAGDFLMQHSSNEALFLYRHDGTANRSILECTSDAVLKLLDGAQAASTVTLGSTGQTSQLDVGKGGANALAYLIKAETGTAALRWYNVSAADSEGDWSAETNSTEDWSLTRYDGAAWQSIITSTDDINLKLLGGAQGTSTVTVGASGQTSILQLGQFGGTASALYVTKPGTGSGLIDWYSGTTTLKDGDFRMVHDSSENWYFQRHNGSAFKNMIGVTADTGMALMGDAPSSGTLDVGNAAYPTASYATVNIRGGATSTPRLVFDSTNHRIAYTRSTDTMDFYCNGTSNMGVSATQWGVFGSLSAQTAAFTRNATVVEDRTLLASASATVTNNNNVIAAIIATLQAHGIAA